MTKDTVRLACQNGVGTLTIDNPPVNALGESVVAELESLFLGENRARLRDLKALVITGAGEKCFVAGADISAFPALKRDDGIRFVKRRTDIYDAIASFPCPVIFAVNGMALGGGLELALACDLRVVAKNARLGVPETGLGIFPGIGGTQRLPRLVGPGMAKRMVFTGAPVSAEEALRIGLCEQLAEPGAALQDALALAQAIAANGPVAVREAKRVINEGLELPLAAAMALENRVFGSLCDTDDKNEGAAAFMEKRRPVFTGK